MDAQVWLTISMDGLDVYNKDTYLDVTVKLWVVRINYPVTTWPCYCAYFKSALHNNCVQGKQACQTPYQAN